MKKNRLVTLIAAVIMSNAGLAFGTTAYDTDILGDSPVSYWPMQETSGPTIHDVVTTNAGPFNGTLQISTDGFASGAVDGQGKNWGIIHETFTNSTSTAATDGATYLFGGPGGQGVSGDTAIYFTNLNGQLNNAQIAMGTNGTGAYEAQLDNAIWTAEAWIKVPTYTIGWTSNSYQIPLGLNAYGNSGGTANGWLMGVKTDSSGSGAYGEMFFDAGTGTAFASNGPSAQVFSGQWVYAVQEYNGAATVIYTNGTLMASNAQTYEPLSHSATHELPFIIGSQTAYYFGGSTFSANTRADFWHGGISHVAYYNYALPAGKISAHYQAGGIVIIPPPPEPTLSIQKSGSDVTVSWSNGFLLEATNVRGPWVVPPTNETSPQVIATTNSQLFFLASSQPYTVPPTNPPSINTQPASQTNYVTQMATFTVTAAGTAPLSYQWQVESGGVYENLNAGGQFSGVTSATLTISSLVATNATNYEVVVTNSAGSVTSAVAALTVLGDAPSITTQPTSRTNYVGETALFTVNASGLPPLSYQWQVESNGVYASLSAGGQFLGATNATLTISSLALTNATNYIVVVTNSAGSVTSAVAALTVQTNSSYQTLILGDSPVSYWPMQETTGPTIYDIVSTNNGTLMTSTDGTALGTNQHNAFVTAGSGSTDGSTYLLGGPGLLPGDKAIYFTNLNSSVNNSQIVVPYNPALDPSTNLTAEAWINVPTYPIGYTKTTNQVALGLEAFGGAENGWWMSFDTDASTSAGTEGEMQFNMAYYPGLWVPAPSSAYSLTAQWVYAVEVYTGSNSNLVCYTNGVQMATLGMTAYYESEGLYGPHKLPFIIGSFSSPGGTNGGYDGGGTLATGFERGNFWHGGISHVAIYNYALTPAQVANHYYYGVNAVTTNPPTITAQPASQTNIAGATATFAVTANGLPPLSYQWRVEANGVYANLSAGGQFSGVTNATLSISTLVSNNATNYEVVVSNIYGSVTSAPATLAITTNIISGTAKIMCLGDSITAMDVCDWRPDLANELTAAGYNYKMVGRNAGTACPPGQNDNEGWPGDTTSDIISLLPAALTANVPDICMLHIGVNDLSGDAPNPTAVNLAQIIRILQATNKNMIIVCSQIIPCELCPTVWEYDYLVPTINAALSTPTSPVVTADVFDNFNCLVYFEGGPGPHPGAAGGQFMCNVYYPIITSILNGVIPTRPPLPAPFPGPSGYVLCSYDNNGAFTVNFPYPTNIAYGTPTNYGLNPTNVTGTYIGAPGSISAYYYFTNISGNFQFNGNLGSPDPGEETFGYVKAPGIGIPGIPETAP